MTDAATQAFFEKHAFFGLAQVSSPLWTP